MHSLIFSTLLRTVVCASVLLLVTVAPVQAATVYSNLTASDGFSTSGLQLSSAGGNTTGASMNFVASCTYWLTGVDLALQAYDWVPNSEATISINANVPGDLYTLGPDLMTWNISNAPIFTGSNPALLHLTATSALQLTAGTTYWMTVRPTGSQSYFSWLDNSTGATGIFRVITNGSLSTNTSIPLLAFRVLGSDSEVPEPSAVWLTLAGAIVVAGLRVRAIRSRQ